MKKIFKKPLWFTVITTLCLVVITLFAASGCDKSETLPKTDNNVSFTPCQQREMRSSSEFSEKVDVEFTSKGVQITHYDFEVTCDFSTVNVTHTFVNGVLNITQQGSPHQAKCTCYTDVSYTINGIAQNEVNVIFINGVQVYCHSEKYPIEIPFTEYTLPETCQWKNLDYEEYGNFDYKPHLIIINSDRELENYIVCTSGSYPAINFDEQTLLLARGIATSGIVYFNCSHLQQLAEQSYEMEIDICAGFTAVMSPWELSILVNKLSNECVIKLTINSKQFKE